MEDHQEIMFMGSMMCTSCGSLAHKKGVCTTDAVKLRIDKNPSDHFAEVFSSVDHWAVGSRMRTSQNGKKFELSKFFPQGEIQFKFKINGSEWRCSNYFDRKVCKEGQLNNVVFISKSIKERFLVRPRVEASSLELFESNGGDSFSKKIEVQFVLNFPCRNLMIVKAKGSSEDQIKLQGSWDDWREPLRFQQHLKDEKVWQAFKNLEPKPYMFKYNLNGKWLLDTCLTTTKVGNFENHIVDLSAIYDEDFCSVSDLPNSFKENVRFKSITLPGLHAVYAHTMSLVGEELYIFGGVFREGLSNSLQVFNPITEKFRDVEFKDSEGPPPFAYHSAITLGQKICLFGGPNSSLTKHIYTYCTVSHAWSHTAFPVVDPPREGYSATLRQNSGRVYLFGGYHSSLEDKHEKTFSELLVLYVNLMHLQPLHIWNKAEPEPRAHHSAVFVGWRLFIFGGCEIKNGKKINLKNDLWSIDVFDHDKLRWKKVVAEGPVPEARCHHAADVIGKSIVIYGGEGSSEHGEGEFLGDLWIFETLKSIWTKIVLPESWGPERSFSDMKAVNGSLYIFGGKLSKKSKAKDGESILKITFI